MSDETTALEIYKKAGLNEGESAQVAQWISDGKPGLAQAKAEQLLLIYINGYTCDEIHKQFPQYPLPLILWAKAIYKWDEARDNYRTNLTQQVVQTALTACADSIRFISDLMSATHLKIRREVMAYLADPENNPAPAILPQNVREYSILHQTLKEAMGSGKGGKAEGDSTPASLNININTEKAKPSIEVKPVDVKAALKAKLGEKK